MVTAFPAPMHVKFEKEIMQKHDDYRNFRKLNIMAIKRLFNLDRRLLDDEQGVRGH